VHVPDWDPGHHDLQLRTLVRRVARAREGCCADHDRRRAGPPTGVWGDAVPETNGMVRMSNGDAPKPMGSWRPRSCQNRKIVLCARSHDASEERTRVRARAQGGRPAISGDPEGAKEGRCRHPQDSDHARSRHRHGAAE
jgi:hypothetical protein